MKVEDRAAVAEAVSTGFQPRHERLTLRELRARRDLSLRDLEAEVGLSRGVISGIETGQRLPTPAQITTLAAFYGVDVETCQFVVLATFEAAA